MDEGYHCSSHSLNPPAPLAAIDLNAKSSLKLSFVTIDTSTGESVQPRSAQVLFQDESGQEAVGSVNVKANGKGSYVLVRPPPVFPTSLDLKLAKLPLIDTLPTIMREKRN